MKHLTVEEAQAQLASLVKAGEPVEIIQDGVVVARLDPASGRSNKIDVSAIREFQSRLKGSITDTQAELDAWKNESRY